MTTGIVIQLSAALENASVDEFLVALRKVAESQKMGLVEQRAGLAQSSLSRALVAGSNPKIGTVIAVLKALSMRLTVAGEDDSLDQKIMRERASRGGKRRLATMTAEQRSAVAKRAALARWKKPK